MKVFFILLLSVCLIAPIGYYLHSSYLLGQFDSAIMTTHQLVDAETNFAKAHPERGYSCHLSELVRENRIEGGLELAGTGRRSGYLFEIKSCGGSTDGRPNPTYKIIARRTNGDGAVCADQSGVVHLNDPICDQK